jgi:uncharacterized flavoprotein (TIGR03862 family)
MSPSTHSQLAVIGGGPAGLRAAEVASAAGIQVTLFDSKPSVGRKFLVAGKGGLNLTHGEPLERFISRYSGPDQPNQIWHEMVEAFPPNALRDWASSLDVETFQATSGRVYPKDLTAAPLLRRWIARLRAQGVRFLMNHRLTSLSGVLPFHLGFENGAGFTADAVIFALGGGSWKKTGSDGQWIDLLKNLGVSVNPLAPANCGWEVAWPSEFLALAEGKPIKNVHVSAGGKTILGELLVTSYGLEGGPIYQLGATLRKMSNPQVSLDFKPSHTHEQLLRKMESVRRNFIEEARIRWKLSDAAYAILARQSWSDVESLAREVKNCTIRLIGPRPIDEAISSAGGVCWNELTPELMLKKTPWVVCCWRNDGLGGADRRVSHAGLFRHGNPCRKISRPLVEQIRRRPKAF